MFVRPRFSYGVLIPGCDVVTALSIALVLVQVWLMNAAAPTTHFLTLGLSWDGLLHGRLWQFVTYALVHASWVHLALNLLMFWLVGGSVMRLAGQLWFLLIVIVGMFVGGGLHIVFDGLLIRAGYHGSQLVGISGACFALLLTLAVLVPEQRVGFLPLRMRNLGLGLLISELLLLLMTPALGCPGFAFFGELIVHAGYGALFSISHACHLGGAVVGWLFARQFLMRRGYLAKMSFGEEG